MPTTILALLLATAHADTIKLECRPLKRPEIQGEERFARISFTANGATFEASDMASPFTNIVAPYALENRHYTDDDETAMARWVDKDHNQMVRVSLVFLGSWWGAIVDIAADVPRPWSMQAERMELRCLEKPL